MRDRKYSVRSENLKHLIEQSYPPIPLSDFVEPPLVTRKGIVRRTAYYSLFASTRTAGLAVGVELLEHRRHLGVGEERGLADLQCAPVHLGECLDLDRELECRLE